MDNLNVDWSSRWILCCFFGCEGKIHKPKPWINQACREIHTGTLGMKLTSVVSKLEIKINLSKSKVKLHPYSKSISTKKCVISPLFKINMHHQMWNRAPTPNRYAPPPRTCTRGLQHENWVCRPLHPKKQDKIQPLLQSKLRLSIHSSHNGLNYLGRIIACCSMRIVSRTGGVAVCTLSLHAEGPWSKSWQVVHIDLQEGWFHIWWCILISNKGDITHLVVDMDL